MTLTDGADLTRLNAPFGARCFMTVSVTKIGLILIGGLNAPFGARCFMTRGGRARPAS